MSAIIILIVVSLTVAVLFLIGFLWAVNAGQYDDSYTPSMRMLQDDGTTNTNNKSINHKK